MTKTKNNNYTMTTGEYVETFTAEERALARETHVVGWENRCWKCDCRIGGAWWNLPCGVKLPEHVAPWAWTIRWNA